MQTEPNSEREDRPRDEMHVQESAVDAESPNMFGASTFTTAVTVEPMSSTVQVAQTTAGDAGRPETIVVHPSMPDPANYRDLGGQTGIVEGHESPYVFDAHRGHSFFSPVPLESPGFNNEPEEQNGHRDSRINSGPPVFIRPSRTRTYFSYGARRRATMASNFLPPTSSSLPQYTSAASGLPNQRPQHYYGAFLAMK